MKKEQQEEKRIRDEFEEAVTGKTMEKAKQKEKYY